MKDEPYELFLDSGAFSVENSGVPIDIQEYIAYLQDNKEHIDIYANLDVIDNVEETLKNQKIMEKAGLKPLPCFHMDEDFKYLRDYVEKYPYIALGGMVGQDKKEIIPWLDKCFKIICDKNGKPRIKVHGFGIGDVELLWRYPFFYSVDSTSWLRLGINGSVNVPKSKNGKYDYSQTPYTIAVPDILRSTKKKGKNYWDKLPDDLKAYCLKYFTEKGYKLGKSGKIRLEKKSYNIKEDERLNPHADRHGLFGVEPIIENGLSNNPNHRHELNAIFYLDLEKALNKHSR
jgi:hypothetical protein